MTRTRPGRAGCGAAAASAVALAFGAACGAGPARAAPVARPARAAPVVTPPAPAVAVAHAAVTTVEGEVVPYEIGTLRVPENRAAKASRTIEIAFARLRAARPAPAPPIVFLPGGPGASYLDAFTGASEDARRRLAMFRRYAAVADVVVFDQRGFSKRGTPLAAPRVASGAADRPDTVEATAATWREFARAAAAANPGRDLAGYDLVQCAADVDDLRRALGYPRVSLLGSSFGSQWAFAVMRLHPDAVARAVLSGVEPIDAGFDLPSDVFAALQRIAFDADRSPALRPYLPPGGVMAALGELRDRFARGPVTVRVRDARSGRDEAVALGLEDLQAALLPGDAEAWPPFVLSLYHGRYEAWARAVAAERRAPPFGDAGPVNPLVDASIGVSAARARQLETDPAVRFLGTWNFAPHRLTRAAWPTRDVGDALRAPAQTSTPVVFLNGDWDTSTPVENMLRAAPYFPQGRAIVVRRGVHEAPSRLTRHAPAAFDAILEFFRTGSTASLPSEITLPAPAFAAPDFPPPAPPAPPASQRR